MSAFSNRPDRLVFPRWRGFKETSNSNELNKERNRFSKPLPTLSIRDQIANWEKEKSVIHAIELLNSCYLIDDKETCIEAAEFILINCNDKTHPIISLARLVSGVKEEKSTIENSSPIRLFEGINFKLQVKIHEIRLRLQWSPRNAVLYIDLARLYSVIGKLIEAERSIKCALQLCPDDIFVLRSAVRFYIHKSSNVGDGLQSLTFALQLLRKNSRTKYDPWLMATEISLCSYLDKTSSLIKAGQSLIESRSFSSFSLSELSAALGTNELNHSTSKAKKLFTNSLINPNENTVAQAQWATEKIGELPINFGQQNSFEARSYLNMSQSNWNESLDEGLNWLIDQPFSSEPAKHASYLAIIGENIEFSRKVCEFGLQSNPEEFILLNNKAYCLALEGKPEAARKTLKQIDFSTLALSDKIVYTATNGLIYYSKGEIEEGENLYYEAEDTAKRMKDNKTAFHVKAYRLQAQLIYNNVKEDPRDIYNLLKIEQGIFNDMGISKTIQNIGVLITKREQLVNST